MARRRTSYNHRVKGRRTRRKIYKKKTTAKRAAKGRSVYKVTGGWSISRSRKRRRRRRRR